MAWTRGLFRVAELIAPRTGGRLATDLWFQVPAHPRPAELPPDGFTFEVEALGGVVRGTYWGTGPVVYLMHGWGGRGSQLGSFVDPLVASGYRVVMFDALGHGESDRGPSGPGRAHGVEFGRAFDAVAARFGPAQAVVAHSMGAVPTLLTLHYGWLSAQRLVFLAPVADLASYFDAFGRSMRFGPRVRRHLERTVEERTGLPVADFDVRRLATRLASGGGDIPPLLVLHDPADRETSYEASIVIAHQWPDARLITTPGLGHRRLLRDRDVIAAVTGFVVDKATEPALQQVVEPVTEPATEPVVESAVA